MAGDRDSDIKRVYSTVNMRLLPFMLVLYIISYLDRINISFAGSPMKADLHFSDEVFGFGAGIFFLGYCLFGVPSNLIVQKVGTRRWISLLMIVWGFVSVGMAFVQTKDVFLAMRFMLGVAEAGFFPGMILYLTKWFPKRQHGIAVAKFMSAIPVAGVLGGLIASQVLALPVYLGLAPWKWLFVITGSPSIFLGLSVLFYLPDSPQTARWLTENDKQLIADELAADNLAVRSGKSDSDGHANSSPAEASHATAGSVKTSLQTSLLDKLGSLVDPKIWLMCLLYFSVTVSMYGFQLWLPQILEKSCGFNSSECAFYSIFPALFQALGMIFIAGNSDRTGERRGHLAAAAVCAAVSLVLAASTRSPVFIVATLSFTAFGIWGTVGPFWAIATASMTASSSAAGIGLINSIGNLGGFAGPTVIGKIRSTAPDFQSALIFMAMSLVATAIIGFVAGSWRTGPKRQERDQPQSV